GPGPNGPASAVGRRRSEPHAKASAHATASGLRSKMPESDMRLISWNSSEWSARFALDAQFGPERVTAGLLGLGGEDGMVRSTVDDDRLAQREAGGQRGRQRGELRLSCSRAQELEMYLVRGLLPGWEVPEPTAGEADVRRRAVRRAVVVLPDARALKASLRN